MQQIGFIMTLIAGALFAAGLATAARADEQSAVMGQWATIDSILEVAPVGDSLSMRVVALQDPLYLPDETQGPPGTPRLDVNNPDEALRDTPILGLELLSDYAFSKGKWRGQIYDPESGNVYKSIMSVADGKLQMRGYIGLPMLGRTQTFEPVSTCDQHIVAMLAQASLDASACD